MYSNNGAVSERQPFEEERRSVLLFLKKHCLSKNPKKGSSFLSGSSETNHSFESRLVPFKEMVFFRSKKRKEKKRSACFKKNSTTTLFVSKEEPISQRYDSSTDIFFNVEDFVVISLLYSFFLRLVTTFVSLREKTVGE